MRSSYSTLHEMYHGVLQHVRRRPEYTNAPRGHAEIEVLGLSSCLENPRARHCFAEARRQNIVFNYAEALWYLSGKNDLDFISYYAPRMRKYSADGATLPGTGYGAKLFAFGPDGLDQIERAIDVLANDDPDSKRVFVQIFDAYEDIYRSNIDVSCTLGLQFLIRGGALHLIAFMRANDAFVGFLSDVFSFTVIQEYVAARLHVPVGRYYHLVGSLHIYEENLESVDRLLADWQPLQQFDDLPEMPVTSREEVGCILQAEASIRAGILTLEDVGQLKVQKYWIDVLLLFALHRMVRRNEAVSAEVLGRLHPVHRTLFALKFLQSKECGYEDKMG